MEDQTTSISGTWKDILTGDWDNIPNRYENGPLGQSVNSDPSIKYGTRCALFTSGLAISFAVGLGFSGGDIVIIATKEEGTSSPSPDQINNGLFLPDTAWHTDAPKEVEPGTTKLDWYKYNPDTRQNEHSIVHYDDYGRQIGRTDYTTHGYPNDHPDIHHTEVHYDNFYPHGIGWNEILPGPYPGDPQ